MLQAYFDESGKHEGSRIFAFAGVLAEAGEWEILSQRWRVLLQQHKLPEIHMTDIVNGRKTCERRRTFERKLIHKECYDALHGLKLITVGSAIVIDDWDSLTGAEKLRLGSPYELCFQTCIQIMANGLRKELSPSQFELVDCLFDQTDADLVAAAIARYREHAENESYAPFLGAQAFGDSKNNPPLQVADLFAYHCYRFQMARFNYPEGSADFELLPLHVGQLSSMDVAPSGLWDREALQELLTGIRLKEDF